MLLFATNTASAAFASQQLSTPGDVAVVWTFAIGNFTVLMITLYCKAWAPVARQDKFLIGVTALVLCAQFVFKNPLNAIYFACTIEALGTFMVLTKMVKNPNQEHLGGWGLAGISYFCGTAAQVLNQNSQDSLLFSGFVFFECCSGFVAGLLAKTHIQVETFKSSSAIIEATQLMATLNRTVTRKKNL